MSHVEEHDKDDNGHEQKLPSQDNRCTMHVLLDVFMYSLSFLSA
jgi:hypothetical protein